MSTLQTSQPIVSPELQKKLSKFDATEQNQITKALNIHNKEFLGDLLELKYGDNAFTSSGIIFILKALTPDNVGRFKEMMPELKGQTELLPYEIVNKLNGNLPKPSDYAPSLKLPVASQTTMPTVQKNLSLLEKATAIDKKINKIFDELNIDLSEKGNKTENAFKLFKYVVENTKYDNSIMNEKDHDSTLIGMEINDIYRTLVENRGVCSSYSSALSLMFRKAGIESTHITIADKGDIPSGVHEVVTMNLENGKRICDPTLVQSALNDGTIPDVKEKIFAFEEKIFFDNLYGGEKETKFVHDSTLLNPIMQAVQTRLKDSGDDN